MQDMRNAVDTLRRTRLATWDRLLDTCAQYVGSRAYDYTHLTGQSPDALYVKLLTLLTEMGHQQLTGIVDREFMSGLSMIAAMAMPDAMRECMDAVYSLIEVVRQWEAHQNSKDRHASSNSNSAHGGEDGERS